MNDSDLFKYYNAVALRMRLEKRSWNIESHLRTNNWPVSAIVISLIGQSSLILNSDWSIILNIEL